MNRIHFSATALLISGSVLLGALPVKADNVSSSIIRQMKAPDAFNPNLKRLIGNWKGKGRVRPARRFPTSSVKCKMNAKWIEGGRIIMQHMKCKSFLLSIKRTTYIGFDKATGRYIGKDFGNLGPDNVSLSGSGSSNRFNLLMVHRKPGSGKIVRNNLVIRIKGRTSMQTTMTKVSTSRPYEVMDVLYRRLGGGTGGTI